MTKAPKIRLYVEQPLTSGKQIALSEEQCRYLGTVMRLQNDDEVLLFNGKDGEFAAKIAFVGKKNVTAEALQQTRPQQKNADVWLMFAPIKKDRTDFVIEKATELGAAAIVPVITRYTISDKPRLERFRAQAAEAAEQSRRLSVPQIAEAVKLEDLLKNWDSKRILYYMDESGHGVAAAEAFANSKASALLIGPEGGFSSEELTLLRQCAFAQAVDLGPLILRAETAAVAALACWQAVSGNWKGKADV